MPSPENGTCKWSEQEDGEYWETSCGEAFCFIDGTPEDNNMKFCPFCGKPIKQQKAEEKNDE